MPRGRQGIIGKLLSAGIGAGSEAIHRVRSGSSQSGEASSSSAVTREAPAAENLEDEYEYLENIDKLEAEKLVNCGEAERVVIDGKEVLRVRKVNPDSDSDSEDELITNQDEAAWELDDMAERVMPPSYEEAMAPSTESDVKDKEDEMIRRMVGMAGPVPQPVGQIPCPVVLPQRRPRRKDRGFVRAYAPVLEDCGISQDVFLRFLADWEKSSKVRDFQYISPGGRVVKSSNTIQADPWIDVVFVAAGIVGFVPAVAAQVVGTVVQVVAGTARELQSRHRGNTFLDKVNQELFMPRGLYAMVMCFKDQIPGQQRGLLAKLSNRLGTTLFESKKLDLNETIAKYSNPDPNMSSMNKQLKNIRLTNGKTYGQVELPESAELVFPDLDRVAAQELGMKSNEKRPENSGVREKFKDAGVWVQDYMDRRAHAFYEKENPGSSLVVPANQREAMQSRYSDPNHAVNNGSLISLITGGKINPTPRRQAKQARMQERRGMKRENRDARRVARGRLSRGPRLDKRNRPRRQGIIKKVMQQDVLYLLIVNLPSEKEVQDSVTRLESLVEQQQTGAPGPSH
ncbi:hypothetical protein N7526_005929 [Penicillium atrosanguineum]|nr:hypothetical protein N7526_005929 [Penicillium atrosanguineum]